MQSIVNKEFTSANGVIGGCSVAVEIGPSPANAELGISLRPQTPA